MMLTVTVPAENLLLSSLDAAKREMEITGTADDAVLNDFLRQASASVARYCRRVFQIEVVKQTFRRDGFGPVSELILDRTPVASIVSVIENGETLTTSDYEVHADSGRLTRVSGGYEIDWWAPRIVVTYAGGYASGEIPGDVERVTLDLVKRMFYSRSRDPALRSEQVLDVINQSFTAIGSEQTEDGLPLDIAARLRSYRVL